VPYLPLDWQDMLCLSLMEKPHKEMLVVYLSSFTGRCKFNSYLLYVERVMIF
jgi:hypothetical protein